MAHPKSETCEFIPATALVPVCWEDWFWAAFSSDAPFSWGDNNRTLVTASRFVAHAKDVINQSLGGDNPSPEEAAECEAFLSALDELGETYIDLEN